MNCLNILTGKTDTQKFKILDLKRKEYGEAKGIQEIFQMKLTHEDSPNSFKENDSFKENNLDVDAKINENEDSDFEVQT
jgi:preprotein translocase subunit SecB